MSGTVALFQATEPGYSWVSLFAPDPNRQRNRHWRLGLDREGYPKYIHMRNKSYSAATTKHGRADG